MCFQSDGFGDAVYDSYDTIEENNEAILISENMTVSILVFSSTNITIIFLYWSFLIYSSFTKKTSLASHFPNSLLFGLLIGSSSSLARISSHQSTTLFCISLLLFPLSYTIMFSSLFVRQMHIQSFNKISTLYQSLLLFFCVLVQVAVSTQSLLVPHIEDKTTLGSMYLTDILLTIYPFTMLLFNICLSTMLRRKKEYKHEAWSIWILSILSLAVMVVIWLYTTLITKKYTKEIQGKLSS